MQYQYTPYIIPLAIAALFSGWVMLYAWQRRSLPSAAALAALGVCLTEWLVGYIFEVAGADLPTKLFWGRFQYVGITLAPLAWLIFAYLHTHQGRRLQLHYLLALTTIPFATILLVYTTEYHGLVWKTLDISQAENFSALQVSYGPWFWIHFAYSYLLLLAGAFIIMRGLGQMQGLYRGQTVALIIAVIAPWLGNILYLTNLSPIPNLDITPFAFTVTLAGLTWGIFGYQLVNISPIARDVIIDNMADGMIVLDLNARIADMNSAAAHMIGVSAAQAIGKTPDEVLAPWPHIVERFRGLSEANAEVVVGEGEAQRRYSVQITPLQDRAEHALGRLVTIRNIDDEQIPTSKIATQAPKTVVPSIGAGTIPSHETRRAASIWESLISFFAVPINTNLQPPPGINPQWYQARERSFTIIVRIAALIGSIALISAPRIGELITTIPFSLVLITAWALGLIRQVDFKIRTSVALMFLYGLAVVETYHFGYSAESFTFFLTMATAAALMFGRTGSVISLAMSISTLGLLGVLFGNGALQPTHATGEGLVPPETVQQALTSLLVFSATAIALVTSITILMESLHKAWQRENQASNLLQQERDLLEKRVTERTRALAEARDEAVQTSDELRKYFQAIEQSGNTIVITDAQGAIEYANPRFAELTGYTLEEASGKNPRILKSGEHSPEFYRNMWDTIQSGKIWRGELHNRRKDGSLFWESAAIAPVYNHRGELTNYVAIKEDISRIKQAQEALALARDQALEASRMKTQFVAKVSHELRTPLGSIMGYAELLRDEFFGALDHEQKEPVEAIVTNVNFLAGMVNDLLDEARLESKSVSLRMDFFSPPILLEKVVANLSILAANKGLALITEINPPLPERLYGDAQRIEQILVNLTGNAIKFTKTGEVRVTIYQHDPVAWAIRISDTGDGIPPEAQEYIFEPFRQVDNSATRENRGSGLGLTIVKQLVELMDGRISLKSQVGLGSTFTVLLPIINKQE